MPIGKDLAAQPDGDLELPDRLVEATLIGKRIAQAAIRHRKTGIELNRVLQRIDRQAVFAARQMNTTDREVTVCILVVQFYRSLGRGQGFVHCRLVRCHIEIHHAEDNRVCEPGVGAGKAGIEFDRPAKQLLASQIALARELVELRGAKLIEIPRAEVLARPPLGLSLLAQAELASMRAATVSEISS
ncbi:MAG: hypothetical protein HC869_17885 [Rhodospirillales bacterium]|nr:hypothetical protein [Rhodospirillales bacterium]